MDYKTDINDLKELIQECSKINIMDISEEFKNSCEEWYEDILNEENNHLNSPILSNLQNIFKANEYFKNTKKMTIQMIAFRTNDIKLFKHLTDLNYNVLNDLNFTNSAGNNFLMCITQNLRTASLFDNLWFKFTKDLKKNIIEKHLNKINLKNINIFGDNYFTLLVKNNFFFVKDCFDKYFNVFLEKNTKYNIDDLGIDHCDKEGNNFIHLFLSSDDLNYSIINFLVKYKKTNLLGIPNHNNITPLMLMFKYNRIQTLNVLYDFNLFYENNIFNENIFNIFHFDDYGNNCLFYLTKYNYTNKLKRVIKSIILNFDTLNIINTNNESLFIKLLLNNNFTYMVFEFLYSKKEFSVFNYIDKKTNNTAIMYFMYVLGYFYQAYNFENKDKYLNDLIDYENNHIQHKNNYGYNIFNFTVKYLNTELNTKILKKLNYDIELYKANTNDESQIGYNDGYFWGQNSINYSILYYLINSKSTNVFGTSILNKTIDNMINEIFDNIPNINYKYQDDVMKKTDDTYLTLCLTSSKNELMVEKLFQLCKNDYDYINHTSNTNNKLGLKKSNFIITSVTKNYENYLNTFMNLNLVIDQKYFDIIDKETTLLISAIQHKNIDFAYYLIHDNINNIKKINKYLGTIIESKQKNKVPKSAFCELLMCTEFYSGSLDKPKNLYVFKKIVTMSNLYLRNNIKLFNNYYIKHDSLGKAYSDLLFKQSPIIKTQMENIDKAFQLIFSSFKKRINKDLSAQFNSFDLPEKLSHLVFDLIYDIN